MYHALLKKYLWIMYDLVPDPVRPCARPHTYSENDFELLISECVGSAVGIGIGFANRDSPNLNLKLHSGQMAMTPGTRALRRSISLPLYYSFLL